uniref:Putative secreted protein n=1 Tax=Ixodes ricinus TaxID=34613 RepID=A0A147BAV0_IXORI
MASRKHYFFSGCYSAIVAAAVVDVAAARSAAGRPPDPQPMEALAARNWDVATIATLAFTSDFRQHFYDQLPKPQRLTA